MQDPRVAQVFDHIDLEAEPAFVIRPLLEHFEMFRANANGDDVIVQVCCTCEMNITRIGRFLQTDTLLLDPRGQQVHRG